MQVAWKCQSKRAAWGERDSAAHLVFDGRMWLLGGYINNPKSGRRAWARANDVWCSADGLLWEQVTEAAPWPIRNLACAHVFDQRMWVMGGCAAHELDTSLNDVWCSTDGANWTLVVEHAPWEIRAAAGAVVFDDRMWVLGGFEIGTGRHDCDVWTTTDGRQWQRLVEHAPWGPRGMLAAVVYDDKIWILGGGNYQANDSGNDVWCSSDGVDWQRVTSNAPWQPRRFHRVVVYDNALWVIAGHGTDGKNQNDVWISRDGRDWTEVTDPDAWCIRHEPACLVFDDALWLLGGRGPVQDLNNDIWNYRADV